MDRKKGVHFFALLVWIKLRFAQVSLLSNITPTTFMLSFDFKRISQTEISRCYWQLVPLLIRYRVTHLQNIRFQKITAKTTQKTLVAGGQIRSAGGGQVSRQLEVVG